ncbi:MAG: cytochrome c biogenesis CcdA family protein [Candidatus Thorarchaeota archaeon]
MQTIVQIIVNIGFAFSLGFYAAISPCLFPLLPMFLIRSLQSADSRRKSVTITGVLVLGILSSLAVYTVISVFIGLFLIQNQLSIQAILGSIIVFFGIVTMSERLQNALHLTSLNLRSQPQAPSGLFGVYFIGLSYSLLAAPCSGSAVIGFLLYITTQNNIAILSFIFIALTLGISIPYLAIALLSESVRNRMTTTLAESARKVQILVGLLLVIIGTLLILPYFGVHILF